MKKIMTVFIMLLILISCNSKKEELNEEMKQKIQQDISKIDSNMSKADMENMMVLAKINYSSNPEIAIMYFEKLSRYNPEAAMYAADYYIDKKDDINYEKYQKIAAEAGINKAMYNLAWFYSKVGKYREAAEWYLKFLEKNEGNEDAMLNLGLTYGKWEKYEEADKIFKKLGLNEGNGMYYTAVYYKTEKQYDKAEKIYRKMIAEGDGNGYFGLGQMYEDEFKKKKEAEEFYKKGAEMGEMKSAFTIGDKYFDKDKWEESIKYFKIAAEKGNVKAMFNVGLAYKIIGNRTGKYKEAKEWFQKAAENGSEAAKKELKELERYVIE